MAPQPVVENNVTVPQPIGRDGENTNGLDSFRSGTWTPRRTDAQRIANRLAYVFVEENSKTRTEQAENTSEVLGAAAQDEPGAPRAAREPAARRRRKRTWAGCPIRSTPTSQMVNGLRQQLESLSMQLRGEQDRLSMIESQIDAMRQGAGGAAITSTGAAAIQAAQKRINGAAAAARPGARARLDRQASGHRRAPARRSRTRRAELGVARKQTAGGQPRRAAGTPTRCTARSVQERDAARLRIRTLQAAESAGPRADRAVPEPRRVGADGRAGPVVAAARVRPREACATRT